MPTPLKTADSRTRAGLIWDEPGASSMPESQDMGYNTPAMTEVCQRNTEGNLKS